MGERKSPQVAEISSFMPDTTCGRRSLADRPKEASMGVRNLMLTALFASIALGIAAPAFADDDWRRNDQPGWHERQEWRERQEMRERQEWRERQAWRERQEWRERELREQQRLNQSHGFPFAGPSRSNTPPPLYNGNPGFNR
jgi:hypothetical protein